MVDDEVWNKKKEWWGRYDKKIKDLGDYEDGLPKTRTKARRTYKDVI